MASEKVLIIDDEREFTEALSERMETRGIKAVTAATGAEALGIVDKEKFDAVILDMVMPGMDGIETLKRLLEKNPDLQIILLTGHATVQTSVEAIKLGAADFLEKPVDIKKLMEKIKEAGAKRVALVEKQADGAINDILKSKDW